MGSHVDVVRHIYVYTRENQGGYIPDNLYAPTVLLSSIKLAREAFFTGMLSRSLSPLPAVA